MNFTFRNFTSFSQGLSEKKTPRASGRGRERSHAETRQSTLFSTGQEKRPHQSLQIRDFLRTEPTWGKRHPNPSSFLPSHPF